MANWSNPTLTSLYTDFVTEVKNRDVDLALGLDPATTSPTNVPANAIRWNSANSRWEKYASGSWGTLTATYALTSLSLTGSITFEGATDDAFETTLTVADPTADRTITLPNVSGTVVTTGDTGSITSTMIADGTIVNADVNASAAIAGTKISPDFGSQNVTTTGTSTAAGFIPSSATVPSNGLYLPAANQIGLATNGNLRATIDSSGRLLAGTSSSRSTAIGDPRLQVEGTDYSTSSMQMICNSAADATTCSHLAFGRSKTTAIGGTGQVANGDRLGAISWNGAQNSTLSSIAGLIECYVDGEAQTAGDTTDMPGRLVFSTTADGAASPTERLRIQESGDIRIANATAFYPATDNAVAIGANVLRFSVVYAVNGTIQTSDKREKTAVADSSLGTSFIKSLRPVSYKWIEGGKRATGERDDDNNYVYESVPGERTHWGFIAQEVKQAVDAAGVDFGGWVLTDKDDPDSQQALRYDQFIAPLTKALQEALEKIETLEAKVAALESR